ncbi:MAG TPA: fatty acid desaturase [Aliidongia sp.]|nr:fatty acid desaturase [Aliidongia sp.]
MSERTTLLAGLSRFQDPSIRRSLFQLTSTMLGYIAIVATMYVALAHGFWLALFLAIPGAGFIVRLFIIQHDCGHSSYFRSQRANAIVGWLCSIVTFTPFDNWRRQHSMHHAMWNNLDQRQSGADIYSSCLTLDEYRQLPALRKWLHRAMHRPIIAHFVLPPLVFLLLYRVPFDTPQAWRKERRSVHLTNSALAVLFAILIAFLGWKLVLLVQLPIIMMSSISGVWLFSVQHKFDGVEWMRQPQWTPLRAALDGTSYLELPRILQWFTGNIGFHHVHHLLPRVPNYRLQDCHRMLLTLGGRVQRITFAQALTAPSFALWDEDGGRMVQFPR